MIGQRTSGGGRCKLIPFYSENKTSQMVYRLDFINIILWMSTKSAKMFLYLFRSMKCMKIPLYYNSLVVFISLF